MRVSGLPRAAGAEHDVARGPPSGTRGTHDNVVTRVGHVVSFKREFMRYAIILHYLQVKVPTVVVVGSPDPEAHGNA